MLYVFLSLLSFSAWGDGRTRKPLYIGGLWPSTPNPYAYSEYAGVAAQLAIDHINRADLLPGHELFLRHRDSKCNVGLTLYQMGELLRSFDEPTIVLVGEACSPVTQPLAAATQYWNVPLFNFASQSEKLENREVYPRYYHILSTANGINRARAAMLATLNWKKSIILIQSSDFFTLTARDLQEEVERAGLNRPELRVLPVSNDFTSTAQEVKKTGIHIIFGLVYEEAARQVICTFYQNGISSPQFVWILVGWYNGKTWYLNNNNAVKCTPEEMGSAINGHFTFDFVPVRPDLNTTILTGKTASDIVSEFLVRANFSSDTPLTEAFAQYSAYAFDGFLAVGRMLSIAVHQMNSSEQISRIDHFSYDDRNLSDIFNAIMENKMYPFQGLTGRVAPYNLLTREAKRDAGTAQILYIRTGGSASDPVVTNVALFDNSVGRLIDVDGVRNIPWTTTDGEVPLDITSSVVELSDKGAFIAVVIILSLCIISAIYLLLFIRRHRRHSVIKKSFYQLNELIVLGGLMIYMMVLVYGFDGQFFQFKESSLSCCYARTLLLCFGSTLMFGSILVKTVTKLMKRSVAAKMRLDTLLIFNGCLIIGLLLLLDCVLIGLWYGFNPWKKGQQTLSSTVIATHYREKCTSSNKALWISGLISYKCVVVLVCVAAVGIRIKVRGDTEQGNSDSPYIDMTTISISVAVALAAFGFTFVDDPAVQFLLVSLCFITLDSLALIILFYRKVQWIRNGRQELDETTDVGTNKETLELAATEVKDLQKRSEDLRKALVKVMGEVGPGISSSVKTEVKRVLENEFPADVAAQDDN